MTARVMVERAWSEVLTDETMQLMLALGPGCLGLHRVEWQGSWLSADGRRLFCEFIGPDAESVRIATRHAAALWARTWPCEVDDAPGDADAANVLVSGCLGSPLPGCVRSYRSPDGRHGLDLYRTVDAAVLSQMLEQAGKPFDAVWAVRRYAP
jgi:hypothetical protein